MSYIQSPRGYIQYLCSDCHCLFDWPLSWQWGDEHYCEPCFDNLIAHPGYPVQNVFDDNDSPRLYHDMKIVRDPECYGVMRCEAARLRALVVIEQERDAICARRKVLKDKPFYSGDDRQEYHELGMRLTELDSEHADLVALDGIEPT